MLLRVHQLVLHIWRSTSMCLKLIGFSSNYYDFAPYDSCIKNNGLSVKERPSFLLQTCL